MLDQLLIVQLTEFAGEGHSEYRVHGPVRRLSRKERIRVVDCDPDHRLAPALSHLADVLILHLFRPDLVPLVQARRNAGKPTLFEASDQYFDLQPWIPYSLGYLDRTRQEQFWLLLRSVDAVQTSTSYLVDFWKPHARKVFLFPNAVTTGPLPPSIPRPLTIGWVGTASHLADWYTLAPVLQPWLRNRPVRLQVMGDELARDWIRLPSAQYQFRPTGTLTQYQDFLRDIDVCVVPLLPSPFNLGRTDLKFAELAMAGVVGVFAAEGPYPDSVRHGDTGFLYRTNEELFSILTRLEKEPALRERIRMQAHAEIARREQRDLAQERLDAYRSLIAVPRTLPLPVEWETRLPPEYLALLPEAPERCVKQTLSGRNTSDEIFEHLKSNPGYTLARRAAARLRLSQGHTAEALALLEPLLNEKVDSPELLLEAAQIYLLLGDPGMAHSLCERAVAMNPALTGAWAILLRTAGDPGRAGALAESAANNQPRSYLASLAVLKYLPPVEQRARLQTDLQRFSRDLSAEERPYLAATFGRVISELIGPDPEAISLLQLAHETFPESARIADLLGRAHYQRGEQPQAAVAFAEALKIARASQTFAMEFPEGKDPPRLWSLAEYADRWVQERKHA